MSQQAPSAARAPGSPPPPQRPSRVAGSGRLALAACLLALVAAALRSAVPAPALDGPFRHHGLLFGGVLEGVLACLLVALAVRHWRAPRDAAAAAQLRRLLTYLVIAAVIVIPVGYLPLDNLKLKPRPPAPRVTGRGKLQLPHTPAAAMPAAVGIVLAILGVLVAAVLIYLIVRFGLLRLGRRRWRGRAVEIPAAAEGGDDEADLREAVKSGHSALRRVDDTRAAIIACYAAMEESLARAGAERAAADTPDELLGRAARQGLVSGDWAARLTALFYEARFSSHPMPTASRDDAERALAELAVSLARPEPASASGAGR